MPTKKKLLSNIIPKVFDSSGTLLGTIKTFSITLFLQIICFSGRDEKGGLPSTEKKAVVDVDQPAFFLVEVYLPFPTCLFLMVNVNHVKSSGFFGKNI